MRAVGWGASAEVLWMLPVKLWRMATAGLGLVWREPCSL
jgi:hypothetical protein